MASAGMPLDQWQIDSLVDALAERADGNWAASEIGLILPRQNGKGTILEAKTLHALFLAKTPLVLWSSHEFKTSREAFLRVRNLVEGCYAMRKLVKIIRTAAGEEGIELKSGGRLRFVARSRGSGRGFAAPDVILDEAFALTDEHIGALMPTLSAQPNPQIWYTSSAPLPGSSVLRRLMKRGRSGKGTGLTYREWCADPSVASGDVNGWADGNPAKDIRISTETIRRELESMSEPDFRRERLGIVAMEEDGPGVVDEEIWRALADPSSQINGQVAFALDITPDRTAASIGAAGMRADGLRHNELVHQLAPRWLVERAVDLRSKWNVACFVVDGTSPAASLVPELERQGIKRKPDRDETLLVVAGSAEMARACGAWYDAVNTGQVRHIEQSALNTAVFGAERRDTGDGAWRWWRRESAVDITPLTTVTLADYGYALHGDNTPEAAEPWFAFGYEM
jgi:hypothetical protein